MFRSSSLPYVGPFVGFIGLLTISRALPLPGLAVQAAFVTAMLVVIATLSSRAHDLQGSLRVRSWGGSLLIGVLVFAIWVGPDRLFPGYRHYWLFENDLLRAERPSLTEAARSQAAVLWLRTFRAVAIVPVIEELFWRAWLMRWLIRPDFLAIPLGSWSARAFWIVAALFAAEHGPYWDVGLAAGILYNWWMIRTKSVPDLILAHAVTNACLSAYVIMAGKWEYWS